MNWHERIIGHRIITARISRDLERETLPPVFLFTGPRSVGKSTVARALAHALLQTERLETHPDFSSLMRGVDEKTGKAKEGIGVESVESLRMRLEQSATGMWKVALVEEAGALTVAAQNALLKTLEEPRGNTMVFLITEHAHDVLPTVRSRAEEVRFSFVADEDIVEGLKRRGTSPDLIEEMMALADGRPGIACVIAESPAALQTHKIECDRVGRCIAPRFAERLLALRELIPVEEDHVKARRLLAVRLEALEYALRDEVLKGIGLASRSRPSRLTAQEAAAMLRRLAHARLDLEAHVHPPLTLYQIMTPYVSP